MFKAHAPAVFRSADISRLVSVCLFLLAAPTIGPVRARHGTAYSAVRLSIPSVANPPAQRDRQILHRHVERMPCMQLGGTRPPVDARYIYFHTFPFSCQTHRPTPSTA
jgi:hypothetical protein